MVAAISTDPAAGALALVAGLVILSFSRHLGRRAADSYRHVGVPPGEDLQRFGRWVFILIGLAFVGVGGFAMLYPLFA